MKPIKNCLKGEGELEAWLKKYNTCLAIVKP
jgi:hypothetical protein